MAIKIGDQISHTKGDVHRQTHCDPAVPASYSYIGSPIAPDDALLYLTT
jgi:hypothetical protein